MRANMHDQAAKLRQLAEREKTSNEERTDAPPALSVIETAPPARAVPNGTKPEPVESQAAAADDAAEDRKDAAKPSAEPGPEAHPLKTGGRAGIAAERESDAAPAGRETQPAAPAPKRSAPPKPPAPAETHKTAAAAAKKTQPPRKNPAAVRESAASRFPLHARTKVIAVTGGKGGVGKSNVAANLAICFAKMKKRVMLMDADMSLANIDVLFGMTPRLNISHVIRGEKTLGEVLIPGPGGIRILPGGSGIEELAEIPEDRMDHLFEAFAGLDPAPDIFLLDTAAGIHPNVLRFLMAADQVIVVTTPEPTAYVDAYAIIKTIVKRDPAKDIGVIINMAGGANEADEVTRLLRELCRKVLNARFNALGHIPRDPEVIRAVRHQRPLLLMAPGSPAARAILDISATVLQIDVEPPDGRGLMRFFRRLFQTNAAHGGKHVPR